MFQLILGVWLAGPFTYPFRVKTASFGGYHRSEHSPGIVVSTEAARGTVERRGAARARRPARTGSAPSGRGFDRAGDSLLPEEADGEGGTLGRSPL